MNQPRTPRRPGPTGVVRALAAVACAALLLAACADTDLPADEPDDEPGPAVEEEDDGPDTGEVEDDAPGAGDGGPDDADEEADDPDASAAEAVDPAEVGADELGLIPVMMYHQLREDGGSEWDMAPEEFRAELERLFESGYVPISAADLARGHIDVPAGRSPVVLTFDDSTRSQAWLEDGELAPDSAMGILIDVAADHEDVEPIASLYVITSSLFGGGTDGPAIMQALHDAGMELGNHTHTHANLRQLDVDGVQAELATAVDEIRAIVPEAEVTTLSLPLGIYPDDTSLALSGSHGGTDYEHDLVLMVGYEPNVSPFHADYDPAAVARIQTHPDPAFMFGSAWWLDQLDAGSSHRPFVSDGDPDTISFPAEREDELDPAYAERANPY